MVKVGIFWEVVDLRTHSSLYSWDTRGETVVTGHKKRQELYNCTLRKVNSSWRKELIGHSFV